jgi:5-methylthioadenosine/S-adenosylhomocysteine deaminase
MSDKPLKLVVKAGLFLTVDPDRPDPFVGWMTVDEDGRIAGIGPGDPPPTDPAVEVLDARGGFVGPGFVSAHSLNIPP